MKKLAALGLLLAVAAAAFIVYTRQVRRLVGAASLSPVAKDTPEPQSVHPPELGPVVSLPQVGGLHHRYERRAA